MEGTLSMVYAAFTRHFGVIVKSAQATTVPITNSGQDQNMLCCWKCSRSIVSQAPREPCPPIAELTNQDRSAAGKIALNRFMS